MKIALVDHRVSAGGVSRFLYALTGALAASHPEDSFVLFSAPETIERDGLSSMFAGQCNVRVASLTQPTAITSPRDEEAISRTRSAARRRLVDFIKRSRLTYDASLRAYRWYQGVRGLSKPWYRFAFPQAAVDELERYDVVYFAWPYFMEPVAIGAPMVGTFHDFHYRHFPGSYNPEMLRILEAQVPWWLDHVDQIIVSTRYISGELTCHYPDTTTPVNVVYLAPYGRSIAEPAAIGSARDSHGLPERYLIYSGGRPRHKNIIALLKALVVLRDRGIHEIPLVITGIGTEVIGCPDANVSEADAAFEMNAFLAASSLEMGKDVFALGYVSNADVDALTQGAVVVVSASLYEAGCGPAMDAWQAGVPVAFSNIEPFVEQLEVLGVEAAVFDPKDPIDIADRIEDLLENPEKAQRAARRSQEALARCTWDEVAAGYYEVFLRARACHADKGPAPADTTPPGARGPGSPETGI